MGKMIYLDNAATTKTAPEVVQAMVQWHSNMIVPINKFAIG